MKPPLLLWPVLCLLASGCGQERATPPQSPAGLGGPGVVRQVPLVPGGDKPRSPVMANPLDDDRQAELAGQRLYDWMNCSGCHFNGGGGMGPALMDDDWIYGGQPAQIYDSIASGRANGMPAYGGRLQPTEIWQLVTYVRTLGDVEERQRRGSPTDPRQHDR